MKSTKYSDGQDHRRLIANARQSTACTYCDSRNITRTEFATVCHSCGSVERQKYEVRECCNECDLPDACADFGCAIKHGLRDDSNS